MFFCEPCLLSILLNTGHFHPLVLNIPDGVEKVCVPYLPDGQGIPKQSLLVFEQGPASGAEKWQFHPDCRAFMLLHECSQDSKPWCFAVRYQVSD